MTAAEPSVLAVVNRFPAPSQSFVLRKLQGLRDAGLGVTVAATQFDPGAADLGFDLVSLAPWRDLRTGRGSGRAAAARSLARGWRGRAEGGTTATGRRRLVHAPLLSVGADVVHFEFSGIAVAYSDVFDHLGDASIAVSCRGTAERLMPLTDPGRVDALRRVFERVDLIHCVSEDMAGLVTTMGAPADRLLVNRPAIPVEQFAAIADPVDHDGPLRVLSIGRLHWMKGLDDGLRAVAGAMEATAVEYRIVGDGPEREKLVYLVDQLGLGEHVALVGEADQTRVRAELEWADVVLLPSLSEGISNVALEAMAAGRPVVATNCGGMNEVIDDGVDGALVEPGDIAGVSNWLVRLADDPALRQALGTEARSRARAEFGLERQVAVFAEAYRALRRR